MKPVDVTELFQFDNFAPFVVVVNLLFVNGYLLYWLAFSQKLKLDFMGIVVFSIVASSIIAYLFMYLGHRLSPKQSVDKLYDTVAEWCLIVEVILLVGVIYTLFLV